MPSIKKKISEVEEIQKMHKILELREQYKIIYSKYSMYIEAAFKFLIALLGMIVINVNVGTMNILKNPLVVVIVSLVCTLLPKTLVVMILMVAIVAHMSAIAIEAAAVVLVMFIVMYLLFFRFTSKESIVLVLVPAMFLLKIPYVIPIILGLVATPVSIISVGFGTLVYYILSYVGHNYDTIVKVGSEDGFKVLAMFTDEVLKDGGFYFCIIAFGITLAVVYVIKRLSVDYSWIIAVCAGGILEIVLFIVGNIVFDMGLACSMVSAILGGIVSVVIAWFLQFFIHSVDYTRAEKVQFEDDDYFYYVKAVPKIKVTVSDTKPKAKKSNASKKVNAGSKEKRKED